MNNHSTTNNKTGFTLIELLVVIAIIAILASMILAGVNSARQSMGNAQVKAEITAMETALEDFKREYGVYPPSKISLYEDAAAWDSDTRSAQLIKQIWPSFDFVSRDLNADSDMTDVINLNGAECLVFFLGGVLVNTNGELIPKGFSKNPTDPFQLPSVSPNRVGPFFEFKLNRLVLAASGNVHYLDSFPSQTTPYWYISSYQGKGYRYYYYTTDFSDNNIGAVFANHELPNAVNLLNYKQDNHFDNGAPTLFGKTSTSNLPDHLMFMPYLQSGNFPYVVDTTNTIKALHQPWKSSSFQIISPGRDGRYGTGGIYKEGDNSKLSEDDKDNITNFSSGQLN